MYYTVKVIGYVDTFEGIEIEELRTYRINLPDGMTVHEWFETIAQKDLGHFYPTSMESYKE